MAALGGSVAFDTLDDSRDLAIAAGTQTGSVIQLKGLGVHKLRGRGRGDLFVHVQVDTPTGLDDQQKELLLAPGPGPGRGPGHRAPERGDLLEAALGPELTVTAGAAGIPRRSGGPADDRSRSRSSWLGGGHGLRGRSGRTRAHAG